MAKEIIGASDEVNLQKKSTFVRGRVTSSKAKISNEKIKNILPPILVFVFFVAAWEVIVSLLEIPHYIVPKPTDIYNATIENWVNLSSALMTTIIESMIGFLFSVILGIGIALLMASSKIIERSLYPYAIILQTIPIVAIAPIIVIWFGSGMNAIIIIAFTIGFFPMLSNTLIGLNSTDKEMKDLFSLYNASKWQIMWKLRFPAALPYIFAGAKISCTLAIIGAIVGEYIAGVGGSKGGIGFAIIAAATRLQTPYLFALGLSAAVLGVLFFLLVSYVSKVFLSSWHDSEMKSE